MAFLGVPATGGQVGTLLCHLGTGREEGASDRGAGPYNRPGPGASPLGSQPTAWYLRPGTKVRS